MEVRQRLGTQQIKSTSASARLQTVTRFLMLASKKFSTEELFPQVYTELQGIAAACLEGEKADHTLQVGDLVHETWIQLVRSQNISWTAREELIGTACEVMRHVLVDLARKRATVRHGGHLDRVELEVAIFSTEADDDFLVRVNDALEKLESVDPKKARLVKIRFFGGLTMEEAARVISISVPTANRWWAFARAWLKMEIQRNG